MTKAKDTTNQPTTHEYKETENCILVDGYEVSKDLIRRRLYSVDETTQYLISQSLHIPIGYVIATKIKEEHDAKQAEEDAKKAQAAAAAEAFRRAHMRRCIEMFEQGDLIILHDGNKLSTYPADLFTPEECEHIVSIRNKYTTYYTPSDNLIPGIKWLCSTHPGYSVIVTR